MRIRYDARYYRCHEPLVAKVVRTNFTLMPLTSFVGFIAVGVGAAIGAWTRWGLTLWLNPRWGSIGGTCDCLLREASVFIARVAAAGDPRLSRRLDDFFDLFSRSHCAGGAKPNRLGARGWRLAFVCLAVADCTGALLG